MEIFKSILGTAGNSWYCMWIRTTAILFLSALLAREVSSAPPVEFVPEKDFILGALEASLSETFRAFEITDSLERDLVVLVLRGEHREASVVSITLLRPARLEARKEPKVFKRAFDDHFTLRMTKIASDRVERPIAFVSECGIVNGKIDVARERTLLYDERRAWTEEFKGLKPPQNSKNQ